MGETETSPQHRGETRMRILIAEDDATLADGLTRSLRQAGYAGVLYAFYSQYLEPGYYNWTVSAEWLIIVFVGGINSLTGAMFSAVVLTSLPELLRFASAWRIIIYCIIVLLIINYRPNGIFGDWEISRLWKKRKPAGETKA